MKHNTPAQEAKSLGTLFFTFFKIGLFTFGGGYAMLPLLQREIVEKKKWATEEEMLDYFAVGQCTPGVIAVNTATFVGFKEKKLSGAVFATLGIVSPSLVIITIIAALLSNFAHIAAVQNAFAGIRVALGNAWATLVAAEMLAANSGLGYMILMGRNYARADIVILGMVLIGALGALFTGTLGFIERRVIKWRT